MNILNRGGAESVRIPQKMHTEVATLTGRQFEREPGKLAKWHETIVEGAGGSESRIVMKPASRESHLPQDAAAMDVFTVRVDGKNVDIPLFAIGDGASMWSSGQHATESGLASALLTQSIVRQMRHNLYSNPQMLQSFFPGKRVEYLDLDGENQVVDVQHSVADQQDRTEAVRTLALDALEGTLLVDFDGYLDENYSDGRRFLGASSLQFGIALPGEGSDYASLRLFSIGSKEDAGILIRDQNNGRHNLMITMDREDKVFVRPETPGQIRTGKITTADLLEERFVDCPANIVLTTDGIQGDPDPNRYLNDQQRRRKVTGSPAQMAKGIKGMFADSQNPDDQTALILDLSETR